jgi:hypothetical protein
MSRLAARQPSTSTADTVARSDPAPTFAA